ncbi:MAG: hypothetical protein LQ349_005674 [Xanthoria aureola]|nr:MAG: hypothetical protein LQ349_005674 [Xanthoria aureola]
MAEAKEPAKGTFRARLEIQWQHPQLLRHFFVIRQSWGRFHNICRVVSTPRPNTTATRRSHFEWQLIEHAANASHEVYQELPDLNDGLYLTARGLSKAMIMYVDEVNGPVLIIAIRGTVTKGDWMLNVNSRPRSSSKFKMLSVSAVWHGGFLAVAEAMANQTVKEIAKIHSDHPKIDRILFTGHSAGGAIAQIFYAMTMSPDSILSKGSLDWEGDSIRPGVFLSIVNEGDPVPQAQEEFIKTLIDVYMLSREDLDRRYPDGIAIPRGTFRASGHPVILRDAEPDDLHPNLIEIHRTDSRILQQKLFGNPFIHPMREYLDRIQGLSDQGQC